MSTSKVIAITMSLISLILMLILFDKTNEIERHESQEYKNSIISNYHMSTNLYMVATDCDTIYLNEKDKYEALRKGEAELNKLGDKQLFIKELE